MDWAAAEPRQKQAQGNVGWDHRGPRKADPLPGRPPQLHSAQKQEAGPTLRPWASPTQVPAAQGSSMAFPAPNAPEPLHQPLQGGAPGPRAQPQLPARHGAAAPATTRLPNTFRTPGTWPPRVTSRQGPQLPRGSDRWRVPESWGGVAGTRPGLINASHPGRSSRRDPAKGGLPSPSPDG